MVVLKHKSCKVMSTISYYFHLFPIGIRRLRGTGRIFKNLACVKDCRLPWIDSFYSAEYNGKGSRNMITCTFHLLTGMSLLPWECSLVCLGSLSSTNLLKWFHTRSLPEMLFDGDRVGRKRDLSTDDPQREHMIGKHFEACQQNAFLTVCICRILFVNVASPFLEGYQYDNIYIYIHVNNR